MVGLTTGASGNAAAGATAASGSPLAGPAAGAEAIRFAGAWPRAAHEKTSNREKKLKTDFERKSPSLGVSNFAGVKRFWLD
jgi:hypothetical protein